MDVNKKEQADEYYKNGDYDNAIRVYGEILEMEPENYQVLSNRSASYLKQNKYNLSLLDAVKTTKLRPDWGKAWGRVGASLYGLDKIDDALIAYNKANELDPKDFYNKMINQIKSELNEVKNTVMETCLNEFNNNPFMENLLDNVFDSVISNPTILEKLGNPEFQKKIMSLQQNPMQAMYDNEIMGVLSEMMKGFTLA